MPELDPAEVQKSAESIAKALDSQDKDLSAQAMNEMIELFRNDRNAFNQVMKKADSLDGKGSGWDLEVTDRDKDGNVEVAIRRGDSLFVPDIFEKPFQRISGNYKNVVGTDRENSSLGYESGRRLNAMHPDI